MKDDLVIYPILIFFVIYDTNLSNIKTKGYLLVNILFLIKLY
jgi:hypothetical protein